MQSFPKVLKMLRENSNTKEKREALTYIRSNSKKVEATSAIKEEQYKELCKLVVDAVASTDSNMQHEAYETLNVIIRDFKEHSLNLFEAMSQTNRKNRLKILKLLEVVEENAILPVSYDTHAVSFFNDCMHNIQPSCMEWISSEACTDNLQKLLEAENRPLSDDQRLEEETINYAMTLLKRFYKVAAITSDLKVERFDTLLIDKVMVLAYMGHKRQRGPALKLLQQALATNIVSHIRTKYQDVWNRYKGTLQTTYCTRMLLLVTACELDWATQWNISIQYLGTDLHKGAGLINNLLSVEERAFKSTETIIRRQAFLSWKLLVDNFALDAQELATARRIKLLCIPLNAKNSKTELIALTKLEVWWHIIIKLYKDITKFVNPVITQFLNFCFGPLGDTPLLSSKFDIVASPGKRFYKTKVVAVDALCQLLVMKQENHTVFSPILEERLPYSMTDAVFQECYKSVIHSVGEALLVLSQLTDAEMNNRYQLSKILWSNLVNYVQESKMQTKEPMYKDMILVVTELINYAVEKPMIKDLILDVILFEVTNLSKKFYFEDETLIVLVLKLLQASILSEAKKNHYDALKCLLLQCIKRGEEALYRSNALEFFKKISDKLHSLLSAENRNVTVECEVWCMLAEVLTQYTTDLQEINEGTSVEHSFKNAQSILTFPFMYISFEDQKQMYGVAKVWKRLYKEFEVQTDLITTVKPNEILLSTATVLQCCLIKNKKCRSLVANCVDILLSTVNYHCLLESDEVPSILTLIVDLIVASISGARSSDCECALRALSAMLITVFGHEPEKVIRYLQASKPALELVLKSESSTLLKEVINTWETIVSIFKGLNKLISYELLSSYKKLIIQALGHSSSDIKDQTLFIFEIRDALSNDVKQLLDEIENDARKEGLFSKFEATKKEKDNASKSSKHVKLVGSFLNKRSGSPKTMQRQTEKCDMKRVASEPESQDYVFIKTDVKFDVNRLTEHQKEVLKRRREDIPALYNDLSQSSSQDSQQLQEWFDKKSKHVADVDEAHGKTNATSEHVLDRDANKENKIDAAGSEIPDRLINFDSDKSLEEATQSLPLETVAGAKIETDKHDSGSMKESNLKSDGTRKETEKSAVEVTLLNGKTPNVSNEETAESSEEKLSSELVAKRLNFESREEFPDEKAEEDRLSPSVLDNSKRRYRSSVMKATGGTSKSDEATSSQTEPNSQAVHRTLRTKVTQGKSNVSARPKSSDASSSKDKVVDDNKRGVKRKSASDSEAEGGNQRRRRKVIPAPEVPSDSESVKSTESDNITMQTESKSEEMNLSQRTKNEISRLRINMVFDTAIPNRRRSKILEEANKDASTKANLSPENKVTKSKSGDLKTTESVKKIPAKIGEKEGKSNRTQHIMTRRRKRSAKLEVEKSNESDEAGDAKKPFKSKDKETDDDNSQEVEDNCKDLTSAPDDKESNSETQTKEVDPSPEVDAKSESVAPTDEESQSQEEEDIVESSQQLSVTSRLEKKYNEKQCFIKINKIENIHLLKSPESTAEITSASEVTNEYVPAVPAVPVSSALHQPAVFMISTDSNDNDETVKTQIETVDDDKSSSTPPRGVEDSRTDEKSITCEVQKPHDASPSVKSTIIAFSSPKSNNTKRYSKFKPYSTQGRAAHMLGLVTKQARIDTEFPTINLDDEPVLKKTKSKDADESTLVGKKDRLPTLKEGDKVAGPCSSRQEKIFNNMRSSDYCSSPPIKLFSNLKNDGEKISSKTDKIVLDVLGQTESQGEKTNEGNVSPTFDKDELPILEWSSANPPSLTASPSASILKRNRQSAPEPDPDSSTPNKRKRVSFADPPVSKEMGYEIATSGSPHKVNKLTTSRGLMARKDSPLRFKQSRSKMIQIDSEKVGKDEELHGENASEVDLQCERENELLTKIAEDLEYSENIAMDVDGQTSYHFTENESPTEIGPETNICGKVTIDNFSLELEIAEDSVTSKNIKSVLKNESDEGERCRTLGFVENPVKDIENIDLEESATQEDIFGGIDGREDVQILEGDTDDKKFATNNSFCQNNLLDPLKLNVTNDSVISVTPIKGESLEDTVDAENLTGLNSTTNSDEIFCERLIRTSTQTAENVCEQDTLPVTDSLFGSLPLSQESQSSSQFSVEIPRPELLDSTHPIYPSLTLCQEPLKSIVDQLTNPLWVQHLSTYLTNRGLQTVGDLAQLSEREVNRIPVKGNSKAEFVKSILKCFEKTQFVQGTVDMSEQLDDTRNERNSSVNISASFVTNAPSRSASPKTTPKTTQNESLNSSTPLSQSVANKILENAMTENQIVPAVANEFATEVRSNKSASTTQDTPSMLSKTLDDLGGEAKSISSVTVSSSTSSNVIITRTIGRPTTITTGSVSACDSFAGTPSTSTANTTTPVHSKKTIGTCTDPVFLTTPAKKATKSVASQMALEDLLDEIDVNLVLQSAVRRCTAEKLLQQYKIKMRHMPEVELGKETIRLLGIGNKPNYSEVTLKSACRACGVNKVLLRLPDIFGADKQFFVKVLNAYRKKIKAVDCLNALDFNEVKDAICQKCTSSELAEMLSKKLKEEEQEGIRKPMTELSSLNAMLKRMPMDVIISHTVANDELIPSRVVLDIALQNNSPDDIAQALESQSSLVTKNVFDKLWSSRFVVEHIEKTGESKQGLLDIFKAVSSKLSAQDLLKVYCESMKTKLETDEEKD